MTSAQPVSKYTILFEIMATPQEHQVFSLRKILSELWKSS